MEKNESTTPDGVFDITKELNEDEFIPGQFEIWKEYREIYLGLPDGERRLMSLSYNLLFTITNLEMEPEKRQIDIDAVASFGIHFDLVEVSRRRPIIETALALVNRMNEAAFNFHRDQRLALIQKLAGSAGAEVVAIEVPEGASNEEIRALIELQAGKPTIN